MSYLNRKQEKALDRLNRRFEIKSRLLNGMLSIYYSEDLEIRIGFLENPMQFNHRLTRRIKGILPELIQKVKRCACASNLRYRGIKILIYVPSMGIDDISSEGLNKIMFEKKE